MRKIPLNIIIGYTEIYSYQYHILLFSGLVRYMTTDIREREKSRFQFFCYVIVGVNKLVCRSLRHTDKAVSETKMKLAKFFILKEIIRENNKYDLRFKFTLTK